MSAPFVAKATAALGQDKLAGSGEVVIHSYGGSFTDNLRKSVFEPFTEATNIRIIDAIADLAEPQIKAMHEAGRIDWDVAFVISSTYPVMHDAGLFLPTDYRLWENESLKGVPNSACRIDAVVAQQNSTMIVYDERAFPKGGPKNWADFWNVRDFPGTRGLAGVPGIHNMLFALMADRVALEDLWPLSDDKIDRALKKLDEIKPHVSKWWTAGGEPVQLLINREYAMSSAPDGRVLAARKQGAPLRMVWDGATIGEVNWAIPKGGSNSANAQKFIAFVNRAEIAAAFTEATGFASPNTNQLKYISADELPLLSISPENVAKTTRLDFDWQHAKRPDGETNDAHVRERWLAWRKQ
ncbi:ABC transporter substrate-binding protein [Bradyrhizobium brasilense]|uniref:ABC transporter substrate-binding protein n=1 Tax=Bradyrhizobium brasilense TaxID=1419277 RepID=UPI0015A453DF|nr:ABC transporter substrate-binding protein [Bradyrhizobium brasilense]